MRDSVDRGETCPDSKLSQLFTNTMSGHRSSRMTWLPGYHQAIWNGYWSKLSQSVHGRHDLLSALLSSRHQRTTCRTCSMLMKL